MPFFRALFSISFVIYLLTHAVYDIARKLISFGNKAVKTYKKNSVPEYPYVHLGIFMCTFGRFLKLVLSLCRFPRRAGYASVNYHFI
jgi:hypothetical protein